MLRILSTIMNIVRFFALSSQSHSNNSRTNDFSSAHRGLFAFFCWVFFFEEMILSYFPALFLLRFFSLPYCFELPLRAKTNISPSHNYSCSPPRAEAFPLCCVNVATVICLQMEGVVGRLVLDKRFRDWKSIRLIVCCEFVHENINNNLIGEIICSATAGTWLNLFEGNLSLDDFQSHFVPSAF